MEEIAATGARASTIALGTGNQYFRAGFGCQQANFNPALHLSPNVENILISDQFWIQVVYSIPKINIHQNDKARLFLIPYSDAQGTKVMTEANFLVGTNRSIKRWRCGTLKSNDLSYGVSVARQYLPSECRGEVVY